ncbi:hypothetical protein CCAX7_007690 [Capsulimonas corticalis]|uniref:peptidylprolyl isomerase n=1 Tax=Capsulimonas corticalis TaxID=2219043 RepID=A0A402D1W0_9BACT|nr:peptidylprolyl isomerase [Capsulimonas corticalis]BDI28718.1 hypothetical protein CCAX7_007690 [Capsulimonas corticalis]
MKQYLTGILAVILIVSLIFNGILYSRYSTSRPIVTFNGESITKKDYQDALEYQAGKPVLNKMVYAMLVDQAAKRAGVSSKPDQVDARINEMRRSTPQLVPDQAADPVKYATFKQDLGSDISLENLRLKGVTADEAEIQDYYQNHKSQFTLPLQVKTTMVVTDNTQDSGTAEADLKQSLAEDVIARQPGLHVVGVNGFQINMDTLPPPYRNAISQAVLHMNPGDVKTIQLGKDYVTFKVKTADATGLPPLSKIHDLVTRQVMLQKAPSAALVVARLFKEAKPKFNSTRYEAYFQDVESADIK